jgi:hypothetical protein
MALLSVSRQPHIQIRRSIRRLVVEDEPTDHEATPIDIGNVSTR